MGFLDLLYAASMPVLKVLIIAALGLFLALERIDILGQSTRKQVNNLVFFVFNPALVVSSLAATITLKSMVSLWYLPVNLLLTYIIGSGLGWLLLIITRPPQHQKGLILAASSAGNSGNLPLIIIPALCDGKSSLFGDTNKCRKNGMTYAAISLAITAIIFWVYDYNLVRVLSAPTEEAADITLMSIQETTITLRENPTQSVTQCDSPSIDVKRKLKVILDKMKQHVGSFSQHVNLKAVFAPATIAAIVGFFIGTITPLRKFMIGSSAPLRVIEDSASLIGAASIPTTTLIVGANLLKGLKGSGISRRIIFGIVVVRYIFLPLFGIAIVKGALELGLVPADPLYLYVLLLHFTVPPAMNIGVVTQLFGAGESDFSVILLWTYSLASIFLTLWSTFYMWLLQWDSFIH